MEFECKCSALSEKPVRVQGELASCELPAKSTKNKPELRGGEGARGDSCL